MREQGSGGFFEKAAKGSDGKKVANWIMGDFFAMLKARHLELEQSPVKPECIGKLVNLINSGVISGNIGKEVFLLMADTGEEPEKIVEEKGLKQVTDTGAIEAIIDQVIADNPDNTAAYRAGKTALMGWFVGQVMKASKGKANPGMVNQLLSKNSDKGLQEDCRRIVFPASSYWAFVCKGGDYG